MASPKEYGYFIKGSKLSIIEKDTALDNDINSRDYGPDVHRTRFVSPRSTVADGIELEYIYSPKYFIKQTNVTHATITHYRTNGGYLQIKGGSVNYDDTTDVDDFIVLRNAGEFNGLHKITSYDNVDATKDAITLNTKYSGSTNWSTFERTVTLYYRIDVLNDESDELPVSEYLSKAVVYFVKAKMAEDIGQFDLKNAMMREFYRIVEKNDNSKINTIRKIAPHGAAIR
tara:strand:- start:1694 stop:2380 length:687 start_codon:yes stop_codon:yes gene_type:complete